MGRTLAIAFALCLCAQANAACPEGYQCLDTDATVSEINTALAIGDTYIGGTGTITLDADISVPASTTLLTDYEYKSGILTPGVGATFLCVDEGTDYTVNIEGNSAAVTGFTFDAGSAQYCLQTVGSRSGVTITYNRFTNGTYLRFLQNASPSGGTVSYNNFIGSQIYAESIDTATISYNRFWGTENLRPIQIAYGHTVTIDDNYIDGCIAGIIFLANHSIGGAKKAPNDITISDNTVINCSEEGISFDCACDAIAASSIQEYDVVASTSGADTIVLDDANWTGTSTYNNGNYYMGFITGALAGNYYNITAHSAASFTLDTDQAASAMAADQVWIGLPVFDASVIRNVVYMPSDSDDTGIMCWGRCFGVTIGGSAANGNTIVGTGSVVSVNGIRIANLDGLDCCGVSGAGSGRAPNSGNTISYNKLTRALVLDLPQDYGGQAGIYDITTGTYNYNSVGEYDPKEIDRGAYPQFR